MFNAEKLLFVGRIDSISESGIKDSLVKSLVWLNFWYNYAELETRVNVWQQHFRCGYPFTFVDRLNEGLGGFTRASGPVINEDFQDLR